MRGRFLFLLCLLFTFSCLSADTLLNRFEVRKVMKQLFEYHIDKKEISTLVIERSLKSYLSNFDSEKIYLIENEAAAYLKPTPSLLGKIFSEYQEDQFSAYFDLNRSLEKGIIRAREWRGEWASDPNVLVREAESIALEKMDSAKAFAPNILELKERYRAFFLRYLALELKLLSKPLTSGQEPLFINLCEKRFAAIENPYLGIDEAGCICSALEKEHLVYLRTLKALAHSLDAHTAYYSPEEALAMRVQLEKGMCGIGVVLHEGIEGIVISEIVKGGPADKTKMLHEGDTIIEVDGESIKKYSFKKVLEILRGEEGTRMQLSILRKNAQNMDEVRHIELIRSKITIEDKRVDVSYDHFGDGVIGKITLYSFYESDEGISSEKDLRKAIAELRKHGPLYGLILDLRDNSGGFLSQAVKVSSLFISSGVVVISKYSDDTLKYYRAVEGNRFYDGPLVVLISKGSASATEIVAQTLQDYGVAVVVGDCQTYGKGTIQHQTVTSDKSASFFKVTIGRYYTVSGRSTQIEGVKADIIVPTETNFEELGEGYLEYPLSADCIHACYNDNLTDLDPYARKWFTKYYLPTLQPKVDSWHTMIGVLRGNSTERLNQNRNFQFFLKKIKKESQSQDISFGANDLQMDESLNIIKDMVFLKQKSVQLSH